VGYKRLVKPNQYIVVEATEDTWSTGRHRKRTAVTDMRTIVCLALKILVSVLAVEFRVLRSVAVNPASGRNKRCRKTTQKKPKQPIRDETKRRNWWNLKEQFSALTGAMLALYLEKISKTGRPSSWRLFIQMERVLRMRGVGSVVQLSKH
jgi:hypothetical protein